MRHQHRLQLLLLLLPTSAHFTAAAFCLPALLFAAALAGEMPAVDRQVCHVLPATTIKQHFDGPPQDIQHGPWPAKLCTQVSSGSRTAGSFPS